MILVRTLAVGILLAMAALGAERVAAWSGRPRRWIWLGALAGSLMVPALAFWAPALLPQVSRLCCGFSAPAAAPVTGGWIDVGDAPGPAQAAPAPNGPSAMERAAEVAGWAWLMSSGALLLLFAVTAARMHRARARWTPAVMDGAPVLLADRAGPAVIGVLRPAIVLPRWVADAPDEERRLIIAHEKEHLAARDTWVLAASAVLVALAPWNAALWWQHRRLRLALEIDCDARVLAREASPRAYGRALLRTAGASHRLSPLALAWGEPATHLEQRITAMTTPRPRRMRARALPVLALCAASVVIACDVADGRGPVATMKTLRRSPNPPTHANEATYWEQGGTGMVQVGVGASPAEQRRFGVGWALKGPIDISAGPPYPSYPNLATVAYVTAGSAAEEAGVLQGDTIVSVNGAEARRPEVFGRMDVTGERFVMRLRRGGVEREVTVVVRPPEGATAARDAQTPRAVVRARPAAPAADPARETRTAPAAVHAAPVRPAAPPVAASVRFTRPAASVVPAPAPAPAVQAARPAQDSTPRRDPRRFGMNYSYTGSARTLPDGRIVPSAPTRPRVSYVVPGSTVDRAGLQVGDSIMAVNGRSGEAPGLFHGSNVTGTRFVVRFRRDGVERETEFVIPPPSSEPAPAAPR
ncbi:M56 family metallopeptidase [Longimicrobium terrae]|uniref:PDZ domain-containing protein n=1 Tax=Longimicrobium terrae TaxID=1639882 RepID=A0A841H5I5_9BACT|nr:M56 family metallopeptidase [Longimicrobium terrae]MBB4638907.1 hypothetical protein [Longimicrobium terrae]MBB6073146.1 hypothetical protein [Longimicrobium terrae]NNC30167.1 hypothetical protein [Longimicrobium terrae]